MMSSRKYTYLQLWFIFRNKGVGEIVSGQEVILFFHRKYNPSEFIKFLREYALTDNEYVENMTKIHIILET